MSAVQNAVAKEIDHGAAPATKTATETAYRDLTNAERSYWLLNEVASMNGSHVVRLRGRLDEETVRWALAKLQQRHVLLKMRIEAGPPVQYMEDAPPITLRVLPFEEDRWQREMERDVDFRIPWETGPLAHATLLTGEERSDLLLTIHHSIHDGRSAIIAMRDLMAFVGEKLTGIPADLPDLGEERNVDHLIKARGSMLRSIPFFARYLGQIAIKRPKSLPADEWAPHADRRTGIFPVFFTRDETSAMIEACRTHQSTMQGALCTALMLAAADELRDLHNKKSIGVDCTTTVDVRSMLGEPIGDCFGLFVSALVSFHRASADTDFWALSNEVRREVKKTIDSGTIFTLMQIQEMMTRKSKTIDEMKRNIERLRAPAAFITNFGRIDQPNRFGPLVLEAQTGTLSAQFFAGTSLAALVMTINGRMAINFFHAAPLLSRDHAETLARAAVEHLRRATGL